MDLTRMAAFQGIKVSHTKHSHVWLPNCVTTGQAHRHIYTDRRNTNESYVSLCLAADTIKQVKHILMVIGLWPFDPIINSDPPHVMRNICIKYIYCKINKARSNSRHVTKVTWCKMVQKWNEIGERCTAKRNHRGMFKIQTSGKKTSFRKICLNIRTCASPDVGQDQVYFQSPIDCENVNVLSSPAYSVFISQVIWYARVWALLLWMFYSEGNATSE